MVELARQEIGPVARFADGGGLGSLGFGQGGARHHPHAEQDGDEDQQDQPGQQRQHACLQPRSICSLLAQNPPFDLAHLVERAAQALHRFLPLVGQHSAASVQQAAFLHQPDRLFHLVEFQAGKHVDLVDQLFLARCDLGPEQTPQFIERRIDFLAAFLVGRSVSPIERDDIAALSGFGAQCGAVDLFQNPHHGGSLRRLLALAALRLQGLVDEID